MTPPCTHDLLWRFLQESAAVIVLELDDDGCILHANACAESIFGDSLCGRRFQSLPVEFQEMPPLETMRGDPTATHAFDMRTTTGIPQSFTFRFIPRDRRILALGCLDLVEQAMLSRQVLSLNAELAALTRELQKSNAELIRLGELKTQFLGMASHDLRSPLLTIQGYCGLLLQEIHPLLTAEQRACLEGISSATGLMQRIADGFLDLSVVQSGRFALDLSRCSLHRLILRSSATLAPVAELKQVRIIASCSEDLPDALIDEAKIEQVVNNLLGNAVEYTAPASRVWVRAEHRGETFMIVVADEGPGIDPEVATKLFLPFERKRGRFKDASKHAGLGLAIAHRLVEAHRGRISVQNRPGGGAEFTVILPANPQAPAGTKEESTLGAHQSTAGRQAGHR